MQLKKNTKSVLLVFNNIKSLDFFFKVFSQQKWIKIKNLASIISSLRESLLFADQNEKAAKLPETILESFVLCPPIWTHHERLTKTNCTVTYFLFTVCALGYSRKIPNSCGGKRQGPWEIFWKKPLELLGFLLYFSGNSRHNKASALETPQNCVKPHGNSVLNPRSLEVPQLLLDHS